MRLPRRLVRQAHPALVLAGIRGAAQFAHSTLMPVSRTILP
jgi:hypothetical protein